MSTRGLALVFERLYRVNTASSTVSSVKSLNVVPKSVASNPSTFSLVATHVPEAPSSPRNAPRNNPLMLFAR
jgi:hypothetical protein